ncbi:uncharacterized protein LOC123698117 [Colias croceus]|uniref:uncharacterized protein LOC123698117 n=1 Tax=Colias crocea TaxID=72248 RepID=UPI001E27DCEF|nr:uncharacterized protein LOC123698117 [Colias croceus]
MESVNVITIPSDMLKLIPLFGGDKRILNLFFRKCEYIINKFRGHEEQNIYVLHAITSRLIGDAAALLSEREDINTWPALKELLEQHFGDPRSEDCIKISLESCKIKSGESYLEFCNRIQNIRSLLISKVNLSVDMEIKRAKIAIYNHTALNVFLYNLPESMVRIVRLKSPSTLEQALEIVLEEVNFHEQYQSRNRIHNNTTLPRQTPNVTVPQFLQNNPQQRFNFGIPNVPQNAQQAKFGFKFTPQQPFNNNPQFGYRPSFNQNPQFGYRPTFNQNPQFGYRPPQTFGITPQNFGQRPPQNNHFETTDVSMRTAPPRPQNITQPGFRVNETDLHNDNYYYNYNPYDYTNYYSYNPYDYTNYYGCNPYDTNCEYDENEIYTPTDDTQDINVLPSDKKNFQTKASTKKKS